MRNRYLVAYDIADDRRLRKVGKKMADYGTRLQYSVFLVLLSEFERLELEVALAELIKLPDDRVMIVNLGPQKNEPFANLYFMGPVPPLTRPPGPSIF